MPYKDKAKQREAIRKAAAKWRAANPDKHRERNRRYSKQRYIERKSVIVAAKNVPCADCGVEYPTCVMDFDHRDPTTKIMEVGSMVGQGYSIQDLINEINKCDVVCSNCHRIRTYNRRLHLGGV